MYEAFYKLTEKPFSLLPDPEFLMLGKQHSRAFSMLQYGLTNQAGFTVISGEVGCGKTTLIRYLLNVIDDDITVGLISDTNQHQGELLRRILLAFGLDFALETRTGLFDRFTEFLLDEFAMGRRAVLIVDEAQDLETATLEELRTLSNINADKAQILQLILVGQPELRETLRQPSMRQFAQRIAVDYHINPLALDETAAYISHRLKVVGGDPDLFTEEAVRLVHEYAGGVPRLINVLCDRALVYGYGGYKRLIDAGVIAEVAEDKAKSGLYACAMMGGTGLQGSGKAVPGRAVGPQVDGEQIPVGTMYLPEVETAAYVCGAYHVVCTAKYAELFGYPDSGRIEGMAVTDLIAPEDRKLVRAILERPVAEGSLTLNALTSELGVFPIQLDFEPSTIEGEVCVRLIARKIDVQKVLSSRA